MVNEQKKTRLKQKTKKKKEEKKPFKTRSFSCNLSVGTNQRRPGADDRRLLIKYQFVLHSGR